MSDSHIETLATHHYHDREFDTPAVKLLPGEYFVTGKDMVLTTVLGSCVSACIRDSKAGVGGMNHFMLPQDSDPGSKSPVAAMRYGAFAMEILINELLKVGARRERLEAKVFGGGAVLANMTMLNIGERNADFVLRYLQLEQVHIAAQDLRGNLPRRINYFPLTGRVTMRKLQQREDVVLVERAERSMASSLAKPKIAVKPDLFDVDKARKLANKNAWAL
ncbi:Chemoreceptor glutamine deamidase CheD [Polaromonas vacuolata]|uniref:Probable chemoreceptor glutamine deamidase CheD n=1 Tax=Polaromonas vacuolata TaxID=37448 RepID=A0A6H2HD78_9BURK|nr:chemoreceptor glutamine deamidase CheD [Polaromonas vacuolata]QJC57841.1 Chemoreceptor glutamine deamidase CheD [Polaromonas vacuolata]